MCKTCANICSQANIILQGICACHAENGISLLQFAYGACELLFNPFREWVSKGPINKKFLLYMRNKNIRWYQKTSMLAYLSSYLVRHTSRYYPDSRRPNNVVTQPAFAQPQLHRHPVALGISHTQFKG
jgi:hypothetical protein